MKIRTAGNDNTLITARVGELETLHAHDLEEYGKLEDRIVVLEAAAEDQEQCMNIVDGISSELATVAADLNQLNRHLNTMSNYPFQVPPTIM